MISESQLETWFHQGAVQTSALTYDLIKSTIDSKFKSSADIYLQGSYKNSTNIYGDSDVDIVVEYKNTFFQNSIYISEVERTLLNRDNSDSSYDWLTFRNEIISMLQLKYGYSNVVFGDKSVKIKGTNGRLNADVIICFEHRIYLSYSENKRDNYVKGIAFRSMRTNELIINYPEMHYINGIIKNSDEHTNGLFKPLVRVFKNARTSLYNKGLYSIHTPSYFVECLIYNVPDENFVTSYGTSVINILNFLLGKDLSQMKCQNRITNLFGTGIGQWNVKDAETLIIALTKYLLLGD